MKVRNQEMKKETQRDREYERMKNGMKLKNTETMNKSKIERL